MALPIYVKLESRRCTWHHLSELLIELVVPAMIQTVRFLSNVIPPSREKSNMLGEVRTAYGLEHADVVFMNTIKLGAFNAVKVDDPADFLLAQFS